MVHLKCEKGKIRSTTRVFFVRFNTKCSFYGLKTFIYALEKQTNNQKKTVQIPKPLSYLWLFKCVPLYRKGKTEAPKTPTTPTSPMSPSFSSPGGPLSPHLATGDSIRDKCIEMLAAALRTDSETNNNNSALCHWQQYTTAANTVLQVIHSNTDWMQELSLMNYRNSFWVLHNVLNFFLVFTDDYKDFTVNCDGMAAEIEDHIL